MSTSSRIGIRLPGRQDGPVPDPTRNGGRERGWARRRRKRVLYATGVLIAAAIVFLALNAVYGWTAGSSGGSGSRLTATVKRGIVQSSVSASGNVTVAQSAAANFASSGTVTALYVSAGQHVKAGQALAKIDPTSARDALQSAQANLATAQATLTTARSGLTTAQRAANAVSIQQAKLAVTTDAQQLNTDETTLAQARAQLARDAQLGFPPSSSASSGSGATASANASTGSGNSSTGVGNTSTGSGNASSGAGSTSTGSGNGSNGSANATNGLGSTSNGGAGSGSTAAGSSPTTGSTSSTSTHNASLDSATTSTNSASGSGSTAPNGGATTGTGATAAVSGPAVTTTSASAVGTTAATLNGSVDPGGVDTTYHFEYGTSPTNLDATTPTADAGSGSGSVPVTVSVSGLAPNQNYYFALVATNSSGTTNGSLALFMTSAATPIATTGQASSEAATSATLNGSVQPQGLATTYHFDYGSSATSLGSHTATVDAGSGIGSVPAISTATGLSPDTTYYFELVATNSAGTVEGAIGLFTTSGPSAGASTGQASAVGSTTATLSGTVDPGSLDTTDHFEYGTSATNLSSSTPTVNDGSGSGSVSVSATLHGLEPGRTYYFRVAARNSTGTTDGVEETFATAASSKPTVVTGSSSGALTSSVTLSGSVDPAGSDTTDWFEYGTTTAFGSRTAVVDAGSGTTASQVSATLRGLRQDREYVFRLVARNRFGTSIGLDEYLTTAASSRAADEQAVTSDEQAVERQRATVATAKESLLETRATIAANDTPSAATIAQDRATVSEDRATVASDRQALAETTLTSPVAGTVTAVNTSVGAAVSAGSSTVTAAAASSSSSSTGNASTGGGGSGGLSSNSGSSSSGSSAFTIDSLGRLRIVAGFAEADASRIAVGQPVTITFPALPNTEVAGRVSAVSLTSTVVSNVVTYDETIALINPPSTVKDGMTADVSIVDQTASDTLYLASAAITTNGNVSTVELLRDGKETVTRVSTGLVGNSDTQILSGLQAGDVVVEPTVTVTTPTTTSGTTGTGAFAGGGGGFLGGGGLGSRFGGG